MAVIVKNATTSAKAIAVFFNFTNFAYKRYFRRYIIGCCVVPGKNIIYR